VESTTDDIESVEVGVPGLINADVEGLPIVVKLTSTG